MKQLFKSFSHEFGTSLNCILTVAQASQFNAQVMDDVFRQYFDPIIKNAKILSSIVNCMRDYNNLLGNQFYLTYTVFQVREIVEDVIELFIDIIQAKQLVLEVNIQKNLQEIELCSDQERIK